MYRILGNQVLSFNINIFVILWPLEFLSFILNKLNTSFEQCSFKGRAY